MHLSTHRPDPAWAGFVATIAFNFEQKAWKTHPVANSTDRQTCLCRLGCTSTCGPSTPAVWHLTDSCQNHVPSFTFFTFFTKQKVQNHPIKSSNHFDSSHPNSFTISAVSPMVAPQFHHTSAVAHGNSGSFSSSSLCIRAAAVGNGSCRSSSVEFPESRGSGFKHCNYDNEKCLKKCSRVYHYIPKILQRVFLLLFGFWSFSSSSSFNFMPKGTPLCTSTAIKGSSLAPPRRAVSWAT